MEIKVSIGNEGRKIVRPILSNVISQKSIDAIDKIVGSEGSRYALSRPSITIPYTSEVSRILGAPLTHDNSCRFISFDCSIFASGINFFDGRASLNAGDRGLTPESVSFDLIGNGQDFWELLDGINVRDLDLGTVFVNRALIQDSWDLSYDDGKREIWGPFLYGKPTGLIEPNNVTPALSDRDFRPSIYFKSIVDAISVATGWNIESELFDNDIFKDAVYNFTVDTEDVKLANATPCNFTMSRLFTATYPNGTVLTFENATSCDDITLAPDLSSFTSTIAQGYNMTLDVEGSGLFQIAVLVNGGASGIVLPANGSSSINEQFFVDLTVGDTVSFLIFSSGGDATVDSATLTGNGDLYDDRTVIFDKEIFLSSCLHSHSAKEFINAISHQFCLIWRLDSITKTAIAEPRFNYIFKGSTTPGTYDVKKITPLGINQEGMRINKEEYYGKYLRLGYKQNGGYLADKLKNNNGTSAPVYGSRFNGSSSGSGQTFLNPLFTILPLFRYGSLSLLPAMFGDDYDENSLDLPEEWNTEREPTCSLVYRGAAFIYYDEQDGLPHNYRTPWMTQIVESTAPAGVPINKAYQLAYCDTIANGIVPGTTSKIQGLTSTFYLPYFAITDCPEMLVAQVKMNTVQFQNFSFAELKAIQVGPHKVTYLPIKIESFDPINKIARITFIKYLPLLDSITGQIVYYS